MLGAGEPASVLRNCMPQRLHVPPSAHPPACHRRSFPAAEPQQQVAARCDAAAGLPAVAAAAAQAVGSAGQQATIKLVAFCFQYVAVYG